MQTIKIFITLLFSITRVACGCSGGGGEESEPLPSNPIATSQENFGENGNLYKPRSAEDSAGGGNLVVLLSPKFNVQFDSCEIVKRDGQVSPLICINDQPWTHVPFSCFSNGGRQTWRASFPCEEANKVLVVCRDFTQEVTFTFPEALRGQICTCFG